MNESVFKGGISAVEKGQEEHHPWKKESQRESQCGMERTSEHGVVDRPT